MINRMNNTTINAKPEEPEPWLYPLMVAPPLYLYPMLGNFSIVGIHSGEPFCFRYVSMI